MNWLLNLAFIVQIISALALIVVILIQHGQGADMGAAFGSGSAGSLFGASGSASFLSHTTAALATIFLSTTLVLAYFGFSVQTQPSGGSVLERAAITAPAQQPPAAATAPAGAGDSSATIPTEAAPPAAATGGNATSQNDGAAKKAEPAAGAAQIPAD